MMISPASYIEHLQDAGYLELIEERDRLLRFIKEYEEKDIAGDRSGDEWGVHPQPDVRYQVYLEYLSELCSLMQEKYNHDYVWGDCTLHEDAKSMDKE